MTKNVVFVEPQATVTQTAKLMQKHDVGSIPVCQQNALVGIVTDRDIILRNIAQGEDPSQTHVKDIMTGELYTATPEMDIEDATDIMAAQQIKRLPVIENKNMIGIIALADIAVEDDFDYEISQTLSEISED
jgi:CBS domain-containing protein